MCERAQTRARAQRARVSAAAGRNARVVQPGVIPTVAQVERAGVVARGGREESREATLLDHDRRCRCGRRRKHGLTHPVLLEHTAGCARTRVAARARPLGTAAATAGIRAPLPCRAGCIRAAQLAARRCADRQWLLGQMATQRAVQRALEVARGAHVRGRQQPASNNEQPAHRRLEGWGSEVGEIETIRGETEERLFRSRIPGFTSRSFTVFII